MDSSPHRSQLGATGTYTVEPHNDDNERAPSPTSWILALIVLNVCAT